MYSFQNIPAILLSFEQFQVKLSVKKKLNLLASAMQTVIA